MKIYKFWHKEVHEFQNKHNQLDKMTFYGGSNTSQEDAKKSALDKAQKYMEAFKKGDNPFWSYTTEIREEIIEEIDSKNIVTRNHYGALVLNSADTIILDIDQVKETFFESLMFWKKKSRKETLMNQIRKACDLFPKYGFRIYETKNGYRVFVTGINVSPKDQLVQKMFEAFNCDKLYHTLCNKQECYRARLTPKPDYLHCRRKKVRFPRSQQEEIVTTKWIDYYTEKSKDKAVCQFVKNIGQVQITDIIKYHDTKTLGSGKLY